MHSLLLCRAVSQVGSQVDSQALHPVDNRLDNLVHDLVLCRRHNHRCSLQVSQVDNRADSRRLYPRVSLVQSLVDSLQLSLAAYRVHNHRVSQVVRQPHNHRASLPTSHRDSRLARRPVHLH